MTPNEREAPLACNTLLKWWVTLMRRESRSVIKLLLKETSNSNYTFNKQKTVNTLWPLAATVEKEEWEGQQRLCDICLRANGKLSREWGEKKFAKAQNVGMWWSKWERRAAFMPATPFSLRLCTFLTNKDGQKSREHAAWTCLAFFMNPKKKKA